MKRKLALWAALIICAALLTGCGDRLTSGIVLEKEYTPRKAHLQMAPVVCGKSVTMVPRIRIVPQKFRVLVQGEDENGETVTEWWNVNEAQYNAAEIGEEVFR